MFLTLSIITLLILCTTACTNISNETNSIFTSSENSSINTFLNSKNTEELKLTAENFAKAFLSADKEKVKNYLIEPEKIDSYQPPIYYENIVDDSLFLEFKGIYDITSDKTVTISYVFMGKNDIQVSYLDMVVKLVGDDWKIINYYIQG